MTSTPRSRASRTRRSESTLRPQAARPIILWCVTCVGSPPSSPIAIVSRTLSSTPAASSRMCEMCMPPSSPATRASATTSSRAREAAGNVEEARAEAKRAVAHPLPDQLPHPLELGGRGRAVLRADHRRADRAVPDEAREVHARPQLLELVEEGAERQRRRAVRPFDQRRDALPHVVLGRRAFEDPAARVAVQVDESGSRHVPAGLDHAPRRARKPRRDRGDRVTAHPDVRSEPWRAAAVHDAGVADHQVVVLGRAEHSQRATQPRPAAARRAGATWGGARRARSETRRTASRGSAR